MPEPQLNRSKCLLLGGGAREHAIGETICRSGSVELFTLASNHNPGLYKLSRKYHILSERDVDGIADWAVEQDIDFAVIGLEDPLDVGLPDTLAGRGIPTVGPTQEAARLETSKRFLRDLMQRHDIAGQVEYRYFDRVDEVKDFLLHKDADYALKPVGLTAGKGVKVMGVQLASAEEAVSYARSVIEQRIGGAPGLIIEERLIGEEFTLQAFVDGKSIVPMPLVKDFKLAYEGDRGPNTGSMGSYSQADGLLPFVSKQTYETALQILDEIVSALDAEGIVYKGIMYGQFCMTERGPKLIEINARFGDPEAINVLPLLQTDFVEICQAIISGTLTMLDVRFAPKATVCKYVTPPRYPTRPKVGVPLHLDRTAIEALGVKIYFAKVNDGKEADTVLTTTSRSIALVGIGGSVAEAEAMAEEALNHVHGDHHVRHDIGKGVHELAPTPSLTQGAGMETALTGRL
ncbi:MAG TPA: phosphoribosylamine--glycine ligase [Armatimonadota bacterium]|nr:phosphoribosylamine--glycine ligase [Armatimonadota bacterium]